MFIPVPTAITALGTSTESPVPARFSQPQSTWTHGSQVLGAKPTLALLQAVSVKITLDLFSSNVVRHTDLEMSILKEETLTDRSLAADGMAAMQVPVDRHGRGQEEEEPRVESTGKAFAGSNGQAG